MAEKEEKAPDKKEAPKAEDAAKETKAKDASKDSKEKKPRQPVSKSGVRRFVIFSIFFLSALGVGTYIYLKVQMSDEQYAEKGSQEFERMKEHMDFLEGEERAPASAMPEQASEEGTVDRPMVQDNRSLATKGFHYFTDSVVSVQRKVDRLKRAEQVADQLKLENANLRRWAEGLRFDCTVSDAISKTDDFGLKLNEETGAKVGRTLASIPYRPPLHLLPPQLYALAIAYFKVGEDEKAAVILTFLTGLEGNDRFKTARNYLLTGVSWYRLDHFKLAKFYFGKVIGLEGDGQVLTFQAQARLWTAMSEERTGNHGESQKWLLKLVDHHPRSMEAEWVNQRARVPASNGEEEDGSFE